MLNTNKNKRNNYLNWAKYFYAISNSAHSYYLNLYITYQEIISKSKDILKVSISEKQFLDELAEILQETESLVNEIDSIVFDYMQYISSLVAFYYLSRGYACQNFNRI